MRTRLRRSIVLAACALLLIAAAARGQQKKSAGEFYLEYRAAVMKARSVNDILPFMSAERRAQVEKTPADERGKMFEFVQFMTGQVTGIKVVKETPTADGVTLTVEGVDSDKKKGTGTIQILREKGEWKLGKESWSFS